MRGVALSDDGMEQAGMGVGIGDYDLDGHLDFSRRTSSATPVVFTSNDGKGNFDEVTRLAKVGVETRFISWGAGIVDLDNDGIPGSVFRYGKCLSGSGTQTAPISLQDSACAVSQSREWHF